MEIDINNLAAYQEDHRIEAKMAKRQIPNSIWETYSSFANTEGGIILLGVVEESDHSLTVKGVEDAHKLIGDFWNVVNNRQKVSVNSLAHADHYGQQGVVIIRRPESLSFANPGDMRPGVKTALSGGTSDARNSTIMKMFGLLDFGERAGCGIPDMFDICWSELGTRPQYDVTYAPARTTLSVDISKMAEVERTIKADDNDKADDKRTIKVDDNVKTDDKRTKIVEYLRKNGEAKTEELVRVIGSSTTRTKVILYQLVDEGVLIPCGGNRNRTYRLKED